MQWDVARPLGWEMAIGQSISHEGVCLTVTHVSEVSYGVTLVEETLNRTTLSSKKAGDPLNLERAMPANGRFEGHIVQGHVDGVGRCLSVQTLDGSWRYRIEFDKSNAKWLIEKGSIAINGVSLTVAALDANWFEVEIIPHTFLATTFQVLKEHDRVNLEFDVLGKYIARMHSLS